MARGSLDVPDWTDARAYRELLEAERAVFAWEWLRRNEDYRRAALAVLEAKGAGARANQTDALQWHLHAFEDPGLAAPLARPIWTAPRYQWVLRGNAEHAIASDDNFDLQALAPLATLIEHGSIHRLLLSDGYRTLRLDLAGADVRLSPVRLSFELCGLKTLDRPLLVLRRFHSLVLRRRFTRSLHQPVRRARRLVLLLRAFDAINAGANQAEIAEVLLSSSLVRRGWRIHSPSIRSQAQRLVSGARALAAGGFWRLLE
ncbi:MAG: DNA -binding domain-containing protein [Sphingomicrobium sp.]